MKKILSLCLITVFVAGCDSKLSFEKNNNYVSPERADQGIVFILPGIEGESAANHKVRKGLADANMPYALVIYNWGFPLPGIGLLVNQTDVSGNRRAAAKLAEEIFEYQQQYPDRPVYIIGHSGGGGVAIFTLESLGKLSGAKPVDGVFLLSASLSSNYDLTNALWMTKNGIVNCANPDDTAMLKTGTGIFGNVDGGKGNSCGRVGFSRRWPKVWEIKLSARDMGIISNPHYVFTREDLIAKSAPGWLLSDKWPPANAKYIVAGPSVQN